MNILSIDTTADICSIALVQADQEFVFHESRPREHAKILMPQIEQLIKQAKIGFSDIDLIVFGRGPGSFTGVRIATGVAQGLGFALGCPVLPISTLQSVAYSAAIEGAKNVWAAIDARMSEVYFAGFHIDEFGIPQLITEEKVIAPQLINQKFIDTDCFVGNGWAAGYPLPSEFQFKAQIDQRILLPNALHSAKLAQLLIQQGTQPISAELALPIYLRDNVTWDKKPKIGS